MYIRDTVAAAAAFIEMYDKGIKESTTIFLRTF